MTNHNEAGTWRLMGGLFLADRGNSSTYPTSIVFIKLESLAQIRATTAEIEKKFKGLFFSGATCVRFLTVGHIFSFYALIYIRFGMKGIHSGFILYIKCYRTAFMRLLFMADRTRLQGSPSGDIRVSTRNDPTSFDVVGSVASPPRRFSSRHSTSIRTFRRNASVLN